MKRSHLFVSLFIGLALGPLQSQAQIRISELQSQEKSSSKPDWFELTNIGGEVVDLNGFRMDDESGSFDLGATLTGVTSLGIGQSVVFYEAPTTGALTTQQFRDWWGLNGSVLVGSYTGTQISFGSAGDKLNIFNSSGSLVDSVTFSTATKGFSFAWDPNTLTFGAGHLSVLGVGGTFSSTDGDIGSPGFSGMAVVPEPSVISLFGVAAAGILLRRFVRKNRE